MSDRPFLFTGFFLFLLNLRIYKIEIKDMGIQNYQLTPPKDWQQFERLCHKLWMAILKDPCTQMNGRQGQKQAGVDIYGTEISTNKLYGIQCKGKDAHYGKQITKKELQTEVKKALTFSPLHPKVFILATTAPRDKNIQQVAREITEELKSSYKMKVVVWGWEEICARIPDYPTVIAEFYPQHTDITRQLLYGMGELKTLISKSTIQSEAAIKLFDRNQVKRYFTEASNGLLSWPRTLHTNNSWIDRYEELELSIKFDTEAYSSSILLGEPGTGKSALLSKIAQSLIEDDELVLAIKADQLDHSANNFESLGLALGLPGAADDCLKIASQYGSVFLVIDQLDTLSELVDVKTNRLSVLLNLIRKMSNEPNIHILASSRPFEFQYDVRLSSIKAAKIQLSTLKWDLTEQILMDNGIHITEVDESFRSFLCRPSNLNFYLSYLTRNPQKYFQSHIELYEAIWNTSLGSGNIKARRAEFLLQIASAMTNDAKQALPIARYDEYLDDINWLKEAGILVKNANNKSFSFAHQTLHAFVWTRSFIKQNASLKDFVVTHQNNLNVRPRLSTALLYLREADITEYNSQITSILSSDIDSIRCHIVHLAIECIGSHHDPNQQEVAILKSLLGDGHYKGRICKAISGKSRWFDYFEDDILPKLMVADASSKFASTHILSSVLPDKSEAVFNLINRYWEDSNDINYASYTLRNTNTWNDQMRAFAKHLITHPNIESHVPRMLFHLAKEISPTLAIEISAQYFLKKIEDLIETPLPIAPPMPENATEVELYLNDSKNDPKVRFEHLLTFDNAWHDLPEIAQQDPSTFVKEFWSFFLLSCRHTMYDSNWDVNSYNDCSGIWFHLSDDDYRHRENYFSRSLEEAIKLYARNYKREFLTLYANNKKIELLPVQRILMKGLCEIASQDPPFVLRELMQDRRRLRLGSSIGQRYSGSTEAISTISKYLDKNDLKSLEKYISTYHLLDLTVNRSVKDKQYDIFHTRKVRYLLLSAIDSTQRSRDVDKMMTEEERAFGSKIKSWQRVGYTGLVRQISPMNEKQMQLAKDDDIIKCFLTFPDNRDDWTIMNTYKGALELGRTFEKFAQNYPERAATIIKRLNLDNNHSVRLGLIGLGKSSMQLPELLNLISFLETQFAGKDFYNEASLAIKNKISEESPLDYKWLKKIEDWLLLPSNEKPNSQTTENNQGERDQTNQGILWGQGMMYGIPNCDYQILECLTIGYLLRSIPLATEWSNIIVSYIRQGDSSNIWPVFLAVEFPKVIGICKSDDIERIVDAIIEVYPVVLTRTEIAFTLAECVKKVKGQKLFEWLEHLLRENSFRSLQMYGELLAIKWIIDPESKETNLRIDTLFSSNNISALCGLAFTLKNIWTHRKSLITDLYVRLIKLQNPTLSSILLGILHDNDLEVSEELNKIIDEFVANKSFKQCNEHHSFISHCILPLTAAEPSRVAQICEGLISAYGENLGDITTAASSSTSDLITIAITLHNLGQPHQEVGLDIFEKLMDIDSHLAQKALQKIDLLPQLRVVV